MMYLRATLMFLVFCGLSRAADTSDKFFAHDGPVPTIKVEVTKENEYSLRSEPRKKVRCTVSMNGQTWKEVNVNIKGAAGSTRPFDDFPSLTLNFEGDKDSQRFLGVHQKIHLNNEVQDPRVMNEIIASDLFRSAGVPCARATHALVEINDRKLGVYIVVEGFDKHFLKANFQSAAGNLYDGEFIKEIDQPLKRSHGSGDVVDGSDLKALAVACREKDLTKRYAKVAELCDVDRYLTMMAIEVATWHWDSYSMHRNNYRVYHDPITKKFVFMPHGMDQLWQDPNATYRPQFEGLVARKLLDTTEGKERARKSLEEVLDKYYKVEEVQKKIDTLVARLKPALEPINKERMKRIEAENEGFKQAIKDRETSIRRQMTK